MKEKRRSPLTIAFLTILLDLVGFGIMIPIQPFYAEYFGASPTLITLLGASYSCMQFLFAPFWGALSDRFGRRPIMLMSISIGIVGYLLIGFAQSLAFLFAARILSGFGNANLGTAQSIVADVLPPNERARGMGIVGAAFGLGFVLGPVMGGILGTFGPNVPPLVSAGLGMCTLTFAYFSLPETLSKENRAAPRPVVPGAELLRVFRHPGLGEFLWVSICAGTAFAMMEQVIGLLIEHRWVVEINPELRFTKASMLTAIFLLIVGIAIAGVQGGLIGRLSKRFPETTLIRAGLLILMVTLAGIPAVAALGSFPLFCVMGVLLAAGSGIINPSLSSALSRRAAASEQGGVLGANQSASALGRVVGPACAGALFEISHGAPFVIGAALMALAFMLSFAIREEIDSVSFASAPTPQA